ncbi:ATP-dependent Clp protease ATP-binding subunit [Candidatus Gottesmanbacteria bacterium]|nr:ATP-dependent Clp protease ATP-binding subunit [Candidatus Gottesmanbacteria bacterium]
MLPQFINWYYGSNLKKILIIGRNLSILSTHYFAISYHFHTLLSPWKRQYLKVKNPWNLATLTTALSFNLIARGIGAVLRLLVILSGIIVSTITTVLCLLAITIYLFISPIFIPYFILAIGKKQKSKAEKLLSQYEKNLDLLLRKIINTDEVAFILDHLGISPQNLLKYLDSVEKNVDQKFPSQHIASYGDILVVLYDSYYPFKIFCEKNEISIQDLQETSIWYKKLVNFPKIRVSWENLDSLLRLSSVGRDWGFGYTPLLDQITENQTEKFSLFPRVVGRDKEIMSLQRILSKDTQNSIIVYGTPGVGRHAIVAGLANLIHHGQAHHSLFDKRVLYFDPKAIFSWYKNDLNLKKTMTELLTEGQNAGNIILVIDEIENYLQSSKGKFNFIEEFEEFLSNGRLQVIGITDTLNFYQVFKPNPILTKLFDEIEITPPDTSEVMEELALSIVPVLEYKNGVTITLQTLREIVSLSNRYASQNPFPEKAIDLLDEVISFAKDEKHETVVLPHHVRELLTIKTKIPVGSIKEKEKTILLNLETKLHESIINQEEAVKSISASLRRARTGIANPNKPLGSFLFLGPTGVGKTETAKALSRLYYGSENNIIRFDMSQYQAEGVERLIGSIKAQLPGELARKIQDNPFSLLLLDEIEKADKKVLNLFLTLLDEGYVEDIHGRKIDCKNLMVICTSNAAAEYIRQFIVKGKPKDSLTNEVLDFVQKNHIFSPEFLNRFDKVVVFTPLSEGNLRDVARLMLKNLNSRLHKHQISIKITNDLVKKLVTIGHDPVFGARAIRRAIADKIEDQIANRIIKGDIKKGEEIEINL